MLVAIVGDTTLGRGADHRSAGLAGEPRVVQRYTNNAVETDHGRLKAWLRPMRGVKRLRSVRVISVGARSATLPHKRCVSGDAPQREPGGRHAIAGTYVTLGFQCSPPARHRTHR